MTSHNSLWVTIQIVNISMVHGEPGSQDNSASNLMQAIEIHAFQQTWISSLFFPSTKTNKLYEYVR